jgi:hypothetical protein
MVNRQKQQLHSNEEGIVSIIVTVLLMLLLSLIVFTMAANTQREQRQTLDRQLSDQAFYSAESGVNEASRYLYSPAASAPGAPIFEQDCEYPLNPIFASATAANIDPAGTNRISCLQFDKVPDSVEFGDLSLSSPRVVPLEASNFDDRTVRENLKSLTVSWDSRDNRSAPLNGPDCNFTASADPPVLPPNCGHGGVRLELVPAQGPNRQFLSDRRIVLFLLPGADNGENVNVASYGGQPENKQGIIAVARCQIANPDPVTGRRCTIVIDNLNINRNEPGTNGRYIMIMRSLYQPVNITVRGNNASGPIRFANAQFIVDSTGKASDVLRRLQVRIPATRSQIYYPGFAIQAADNVCKLLRVQVDSSSYTGGTTSTTDPTRCPLN